jgi:hypothetical protein
MMTFLQYLDEQEKRVKLYGLGTGHSPGKMFSVVNPAKPAKPTFTGLNVNTVHPVPRNGKPVSGIVMKRVSH